MKHLCYFKATLRLLAALCCAALASCSSPSTGEQEQSDFRMMVRLWPVHHNDSTLTDQLITAFRKYDFCDEVWLCSETPATHELSWHAPSARRMGVAARKFRDAGIIPSLQVVALGHGDGAVSFGPIKDTTIHWGTMVGPNGEVTASVNCPRQSLCQRGTSPQPLSGRRPSGHKSCPCSFRMLLRHLHHPVQQAVRLLLRQRIPGRCPYCQPGRRQGPQRLDRLRAGEPGRGGASHITRSPPCQS